MTNLPLTQEGGFASSDQIKLELHTVRTSTPGLVPKPELQE